MLCRSVTLALFVVAIATLATTQTQSTLSAETGNNTSACSSSTNPSYCNIALPNFMTKFTGAQTVYIAPTPGHVSPQTIQQSYLYPGATTRIIAAYQPWFNPGNCWTGTVTAGHPCVGYSENNSAVIAQQHSTMLARGFTDVSPDWYGNSSSQSFLNQTVIDEAADLSGRCTGSSCPMHLMIMIDKGLITAGMSNAAACPTGSSNQTTCITNVLNAAYDYIDANWGRKPYYSVDSVSGQPITLTFLDETSWSGTTWSTVWANVKAHMSTYATPYKIVKEFGNFTEANIDGAYAWVRTQPFTQTAQLCWQGWISGSTCDNYMTRYYSQARSSGKLQMGGLYPGFDGSENNYNNGVTARQCGQVLVFHGTAITAAGYSSTSQLPWLLAATWNDFGEGTNIENGIDNCWRVATPTINATTVTWTQTKTDATYASPTTIDHFRIWYGSGAGDLKLAQDNILPSQYCNSGVTSCSFDLNTAAYPPPGNSYIYIEQIPKALLFIQMNGGGNGNGNPVLYAGSNIQTINNIDDSPFTWSQVNGSATSSFTQAVFTPSKDGGSSKIAITSAPNYSWAKWQTQLGAYDTYSHFTLDLWVEVSEPSRPQSLEFSVGQVVGGHQYFFSFQCDLKGGTGVWEVWNPPSQTWSNTTAPCNALAVNTFTELTFDVQRTTGNQLQYNWLKVNGQQYNINQTLNPTSNSTDGVEVDVIPHIDGTAELYNIWIDEVNLTLQ